MYCKFTEYHVYTFFATYMSIYSWLLFQLSTCSLCMPCTTKPNKNFADFIKKIPWISKVFKNQFLLEENF